MTRSATRSCAIARAWRASKDGTIGGTLGSIVTGGTLVATSVRIGATSSDEKNATAAAYTTRATRPIGAVRGSVIMKNRKMRISGEVTRTDQNSHPLTEPTCQRAVIACPLSTTMPI